MLLLIDDNSDSNNEKIDETEIENQNWEFKLAVWKHMDYLNEFGRADPKIIIECLEIRVERATRSYSPKTEFSEGDSS